MWRGTRTIPLTASLILIVAAIRAPLLPIPLERDEGEYAYIAWRLGYNELPYRDWIDQKPPAVFYIYRFALSLPFEPVRAIHFIGLLFAAASTCALFFLGLRFMDRFWAWLGAALFALLGADPLVQGTAANTELFMLCPLISTQIAIFAAVGLAGLLTSGRVKWSLFVAGSLLTSFIGVSASGYFFPHYFQQLLPPLVLAAAAGAERLAAVKLWKIIPAWGRRAALTLLLTILPAITLWPFLFTYTPAEAVRKIYPGNFFAEMPEFARRIESVTPPETSVFIFGAEPELLFYAHRPSATRYIFLFPLYGPYGNAGEKQMATVTEIERAQPSTAVYLPNALFFTAGTDQYFTRWSLSYLQDNFYTDTWLIADEFDGERILQVVTSGESDSFPTGQQLIGAILARKPTSAP